MGAAVSSNRRRQLDFLDDSVHLMATRNRKKNKNAAAAAATSKGQLNKKHLLESVDDSVHMMSRKAHNKKKKYKEQVEEEEEEVEEVASPSKHDRVDASIRASEYTAATTISTSSNDEGGELGNKDEDDHGDDANDNNDGGKKAVSFSTVQFREYPIAIGDNPGGALMGVPITMDWDYNYGSKEATDGEPGVSPSILLLNLDEYEEAQLSRRRHDLELRMSIDDRKKLLKKLGFTVKEIQVGIRNANKTRVQRKATVQYMHLSPVEEVCEKISRAIKNATPVGRSTKQAERALLAKYATGYNKKNSNKTKNNKSSSLDASSRTTTTAKLVESNLEI